MFVWREINHIRTGHRIPGCFRWHHGKRGLCDHEHDEDEREYTCEDARVEMSTIRARIARNCEATCGHCGRDYMPWSADNDIWNEVMPDDGGMLCPTCFMVLFDEPGLVFRVGVRVRGGVSYPKDTPGSRAVSDGA